MEYTVHVYYDNLRDPIEYIGDIPARQGETIAEIKDRILAHLLRNDYGTDFDFDMTMVRETGRRNPDEADFRNPADFFINAIAKHESTKDVLEGLDREFDLFIEMSPDFLSNNNNDEFTNANRANDRAYFNQLEQMRNPPSKSNYSRDGGMRKGSKKRHGGKRKTVRKGLKRKTLKRKTSKSHRHRK